MTFRILHTLVLLCISLGINAQRDIHAHAYRAGDKVERQQVAFKHFEKQGENAVWDLSDIENSNKTSVLEFAENPQDKEEIIANGANTRFYYRQNDTGTYLMGYENNQSKVCYNIPELAYLPSQTIGNKTIGCFNGYAIYAESVFSRIYGTYEYMTEERGTLLLPSKDSIKDVVKVHILKTTGQHYLKGVENSKVLRMLVDSISRYTTDSIFQHFETDSMTVETNLYKWYAKGYRYPIYETEEAHVKGNNLGFKAAYYCPPLSQPSSDNNYQEKTRAVVQKTKPSASQNAQQQSSSRHLFSDGTSVEYSLDIASDGYVNVNLFSSSEEKLSCGIYTVDGITVRQEEFDGSRKGAHRFNASLSSYPHGIYILTISLGGQRFSEKFAYK